MTQVIKLKIGDKATLVGNFHEGTCPKDGAEIVSRIEKGLDEHLDELVKSTYRPQYDEQMKQTCLEHFKKYGEFPKYFAHKILCTHDFEFHKWNMKFLDAAVDAAWKIVSDKRNEKK